MLAKPSFASSVSTRSADGGIEDAGFLGDHSNGCATDQSFGKGKCLAGGQLRGPVTDSDSEILPYSHQHSFSPVSLRLKVALRL
jgi:hypothetical protein